MVSRNPSRRPNRPGTQRAARVGKGDSARDDNAKLLALARSLQHDSGTYINVPFVIVAGVVVALIVLSFLYDWPLWSSLLLIVLFGVVSAVTFARRPVVAPLELTAAERERVELVLVEHGVRPAIMLVRGFYPSESSAAATRTVKIVAERLGERTREADDD